jgi:hypothetical protein
MTDKTPFRVRCIRGNRDQLREGTEYTVSEVVHLQGVKMYGLHKHWPDMLFNAERFEKIE